MENHQNEPPQIFESDYYDHLYEIEEKHWWANGLRLVMDELLQNALADRR